MSKSLFWLSLELFSFFQRIPDLWAFPNFLGGQDHELLGGPLSDVETLADKARRIIFLQFLSGWVHVIFPNFSWDRSVIFALSLVVQLFFKILLSFYDFTDGLLHLLSQVFQFLLAHFDVVMSTVNTIETYAALDGRSDSKEVEVEPTLHLFKNHIPIIQKVIFVEDIYLFCSLNDDILVNNLIFTISFLQVFKNMIVDHQFI